ncbi:MAG: UvrD-helicase domain-containing protein, partial [Ilumatobacteraceae bacterium]
MNEQLELPALFDEPPLPPPDQAARDRVVRDLGTNLFINAGAGSGKTTALVGRVVNLVLAGVPITSVAAITFTEKAAAELRHRIRDALQHAGTTAAEMELAGVALHDVDLAPIGTLHAFARRLLTEFPIESALPPRFDVLDEVQSATAAAERWEDFVEETLERPDAVRLMELCDHDGFRIEVGGKRMSDDFQSNWDLVEERVSPTVPAQTDAQLAPLLALCDSITTVAIPPGDGQQARVADIASLAGLLRDDPTLGDVLTALSSVAGLKSGRTGNQAKWTAAYGGAAGLHELRSAQQRLAEAARSRLAAFHEERRLLLGALLRAATLEAVRQRRLAGELEFHDLLVFARRLVNDHPHVRRSIHGRYTRLLLDEFQDTDPIQLELAIRITSDPDAPADDPDALVPLPGRLCMVGDAKQSIYRFRRADIAQFMSARRSTGADTATLSANFRSTPAVIDWVNHTMGRLITAEEDVQPAYEPLDVCRSAGVHRGSVTVLGQDAHDDEPDANTLRAREAEDVASMVVTALRDGWLVARTVSGGEAEGRTTELAPCRPGDITILLPARTSLPLLEVALAGRGIAYRAENSSLVYAAPEVRSLLLALRAADDPTDELAIVSALRTPLFGCSDRDLYDWKVEHNGAWGWRELPAALAEHPVALGLASLGRVAAAIPWSTPSELLTMLVEQRNVFELALAAPRWLDVLRRLRFVVDQARSWSEAGGHSVRRYLNWTRLQGDDGRFVAETILPETDQDAVRIMTVHAAKGLEFPITIVSGLTTKPARRPGRGGVVWPSGAWTITEQEDELYEAFKPVDDLMSDAERRRLLYVATTRAQDHLVVSLHRSATRNIGSSA